MSKMIIPNFEDPFLLSDFITASFNRGMNYIRWKLLMIKGGDIAMLSIQALFLLITKYNMYDIFD